MSDPWLKRDLREFLVDRDSERREAAAKAAHGPRTAAPWSKP